MTTIEECTTATNKFVSLMKSGDFDAASALMGKIKLLIIQFGVASGASKLSDNAKHEIAASISALEAFVVYSVRTADDESFSRYYSQLKSYYSMVPISATPNQPKVLGLNLLRLLVDNRLAEFHSELELLPQECVESKLVKFPVLLERSLMEGMYSQVLTACKSFPDPLFAEYQGSSFIWYCISSKIL